MTHLNNGGAFTGAQGTVNNDNRQRLGHYCPLMSPLTIHENGGVG